ncbi:MAG: hypothetical protein ACRDF0_05410 [Candidatus Limnocylindria bacterium]
MSGQVLVSATVLYPVVSLDLGHLAQRLLDPFDSASRFYWPLVIGLAVALVANVVWNNWRVPRGDPPAESALRPWAMWTNIIAIIWVLVLLLAKTPAWLITLAFAVDVAVLGYLYLYWLPPREAAWVREQRRQRYIPQPERRKRRRRR